MADETLKAVMEELHAMRHTYQDTGITLPVMSEVAGAAYLRFCKMKGCNPVHPVRFSDIK